MNRLFAVQILHWAIFVLQTIILPPLEINKCFQRFISHLPGEFILIKILIRISVWALVMTFLWSNVKFHRKW